MLRVLLLCLLATLVAACAPRLAPPGPDPTEPRLVLDGDGGGGDAVGALIAEDGLELPLRAWLPPERPRAVVLGLHGFNDYSMAFDAPGRALAERGIAVYAYDQRGFGAGPNAGLWAGSAALAGDLATAARLLRQRHPGSPLYLLGESMGAAVVIVAETAPDAAAVDGLILSAPAVWGRETQPIYQRVALWIAVRLVPGMRPSGRGLKVQASDNVKMLRGLGSDPLFIKNTRIDAIAGLVDLMDEALAAAPQLERRLLLLYGKKDQIVPRSPVKSFWRRLPRGPEQRLAVYENGWHLLLRDLQAERVLTDIAAWIDDPSADLPSGAEGEGARLFDPVETGG